tara:strand:+ start:318 stop:518 length:201 start_codon:yes stop_codon:yes gene_type:complete
MITIGNSNVELLLQREENFTLNNAVFKTDDILEDEAFPLDQEKKEHRTFYIALAVSIGASLLALFS